MSKKKFISIAKEVITLEIQALQKLKKNINNHKITESTLSLDDSDSPLSSLIKLSLLNLRNC